jgi:hypothetical protein
VFLAGVALDLIRFPPAVGQQVGAALPQDVKVGLVLVWGPIPAVVAVISMVIFWSFMHHPRDTTRFAAASARRAPTAL